MPISHPKLTLLFGLLIVMIAGSGLPALKISNNQRIFFADDDPNLIAFNAFENTFGRVDNLLFALVPPGGNVYAREFLSSLAALTEAAWQLPFAGRVQSLTNFQHSEAHDDDLIIQDLVREPSSLSVDDLAAIRDYAQSEEYLYKTLVSANGSVAGVAVTLRLPRADDSKEVPMVMAAAAILVDEFEGRYPGLEIHVTGTAAMDHAFMQASNIDLRTLVPISLFCMIAIIALFVGGLRSGLFATISGIASVLVAMGVAGYAEISISSATSIAPIIILTIVMAQCVHIFDRYLAARRSEKPIAASASVSFDANLFPISIATVTTVIGFLSFNYSRVPPFRDLGNVTAVGSMAALYFSLFCVPAAISLWPIAEPRTLVINRATTDWLANFVIARRIQLLWSFAVLTLLLLAGLFRNELSDIYLNYFDESIPFRADSDFIVENLTGLMQIHYRLESGQPGGITDPKFLADVERFSHWYRSQPECLSVASLASVQKRLNKNLHGDDPHWYRLPDDRELAAQYLLLYEMSLPYGLDVTNEVAVDKSSIRMSVSTETLSSKALVGLNERAEKWVATNAAHIQSASGTSLGVIFSKIGERNIKGMLFGTTFALAAISFVLVIALRSPRIGLISLVPNLLPLGLSFGLWGILVGKIGLSLSVVSSMTLGIIVDDSVHFLAKYNIARRKGRDCETSVRYAFTSCGRALIVTSIALVAGFLILSLSPFLLNATMGLLAAIVIAMAIVCDLIFLPAILLTYDRYNK